MDEVDTLRDLVDGVPHLHLMRLGLRVHCAWNLEIGKHDASEFLILIENINNNQLFINNKKGIPKYYIISILAFDKLQAAE